MVTHRKCTVLIFIWKTRKVNGYNQKRKNYLVLQTETNPKSSRKTKPDPNKLPPKRNHWPGIKQALEETNLRSEKSGKATDLHNTQRQMDKSIYIYLLGNHGLGINRASEEPSQRTEKTGEMKSEGFIHLWKSSSQVSNSSSAYHPKNEFSILRKIQLQIEPKEDTMRLEDNLQDGAAGSP